MGRKGLSVTHRKRTQRRERTQKNTYFTLAPVTNYKCAARKILTTIHSHINPSQTERGFKEPYKYNETQTTVLIVDLHVWSDL